MAGRSRVLFISNGHGEDAVACRLVDRLRAAAPDVDIAAWPMVGRGEAYEARGIRLVGARNLLPSDGFATLDARLLWRDIRAGWVRTHLRQLAFARALRGAYDLIVAVGDVVPIAAAVRARTPFVFVGCAKSSYYGPGWGYTALEKRWLRTPWCALVLPRDARTTHELSAAGVQARYVGNPMMDDLEGTGRDFGIARETTAIALLPGSRQDAPVNAARLLSLVPSSASLGRATAYVVPVTDAFDIDAMPELGGWTRSRATLEEQTSGVVARLEREDTLTLIVRGPRTFADALRRASLAIGMAGTANEQAIGLGLPLIVCAAAGAQGEKFVRMKMRYFGPSAVRAPAERDELVRAMRRLLDDESVRESMRRAGYERMGSPGASDAIVTEIVSRLGGAPDRNVQTPTTEIAI